MNGLLAAVDELLATCGAADAKVWCNGHFDDGVMPTRCTTAGGCERPGCPRNLGMPPATT